MGALEGVALTFTDGASLKGGGFVFTATAEDTLDSYADGPCAGSSIGFVDAQGQLQRHLPVDQKVKLEGLAVQEFSDRFELLLVTDADDERLAAQLFRAEIAR